MGRTFQSGQHHVISIDYGNAKGDYFVDRYVENNVVGCPLEQLLGANV